MFKVLLEKDHTEVDQLYNEVVDRLDAGSSEEVLERLDLFWARLAVHIRAEHLHLFPAVLRFAATGVSTQNGSQPDLADVVSQLRGDHNSFMYELARAIKELRALAADDLNLDGVPEDIRGRLAVVKLGLDRHNRLEEERIYSLEDLLMSHEDVEELNRLIGKELANMPSRFTSQTDPKAGR